MATGSANASSGAHPARLQLAELNGRSAPLGSWEVSVFHPRLEKYQYMDKTTRESKTGESFRCLLVSSDDPSCYIQAQVSLRGTNRAPLERAQAKFQENKSFLMSKVVFLSNASQAYLHAPLKQMVSLEKTKFDPVLSKADGQQVNAQPTMTLSEMQELQQNQLFDVTALVADISDGKPAGSTGRYVRDVKLIDQSGEDKKVQEVVVSFFHEQTPTIAERVMIETMTDCKGGSTPLSFFALGGKKTDRGFSVANAKEFFIVQAVGKRADDLRAAAAALQSTPMADRQLLEQGTFSARDYSDEQGVQSFCSILRTMTGRTNVKDIDEEDTLWQLNWTEVAWPTETDPERLCTKDQKRLFFSTNIRDGTGVGPLVWMTEESALKLSCLDSKEQFLDFHATGKQSFPIMASLKILRRHRKSGDGAETDQASFVIVHADDQSLKEGPTAASFELFPWMKNASHDSAAIIPAPLSFIKRSTHYAFQVQLPQALPSDRSVAIPCQKIISLVKSLKASKSEQLGSGFKLVTHGVVDVLANGSEEEGSKSAATFVLSSTCSLENLTQYRMDPPRGGGLFALVTITAKIGEVFVVDQVQHLLSEERANEAKESLLKLLHLAREFGNEDRKRDAPWTDAESPASAKKCRKLGRSPTDSPLPQAVIDLFQ